MSEPQLDTPLARAVHAVQSANRAAASASAERFKIGILTPLTDTGWVVAGEAMVRGACLAADYVRAHGGVCGGKQLELVLENDQATARQESMARSAVAGMAKLAIFDDVLAVLGQWHVRTTPWVVELSERLGIAHFVTTGHPDVTAKQYPSVFRTFYTTSERADLMVRFMREQGAHRIAILAADSLFGKLFADALEARIDCELLRVDFEQDTVSDVRRELRQIQAWKPDFVVNLGIMVRVNAYEIMNQAAEVGLRPGTPMLAAIPFPNASTEFWSRVGRNGHLVVWPTSQFRKDWPGMRPIGHWFIEHYTRRYGAFPSEMALTAFTDVAIIAEALARGRSQTRAGLIESLETGSFDSWRGAISFERRSDHWHHSPPTLQLMQYQRVGQSFEEAAIVFPPELRTHSYIAPGERTMI